MVFEHLLAKFLNAYVDKSNIFYSLWFSICKGLDTCDTLITIINVVQKTLDIINVAHMALDYGCEIHRAGHDFSAVFDLVNYEDLIFSFKQLGLGNPF